ncbi:MULTISPECIES: hypothetical protein [unclassified Francisella]|uniref:hypothetical protein n=1 Tax=unclassified Francisella TaxID=2610885 RepID=UPI002E316D01|nr:MULTISPECIES: hypothetical protein [unclassified Francisella]MED7819142.1 hypothetical protein [Francisella sp. 19S2-4]MED7830385.1 hypothetical protein [Francisella sp. 19S2-10]
MESNLFNFSRCLVAAVRKQIKYSENIPALYQRNQENSSFVKYRRDSLNSFRFSTANLSNDHLAYYMLNNKIRVGLCQDLATIVAFLSNYMESQIDNAYMTMIRTDGHFFCIAHNNQSLNDNKHVTQLATGLDNLEEITYLSQAILVDPWLYKVSKISDIKEYIQCAKEIRGVSTYLSGPVKTTGYSKIISKNKQLTYNNLMFSRIKHDFNSFYTEEKTLPNLDIDKIKFGLSQDIDRCQCLEDLKIFIKKLSEKSSFWYSSWFCEDKKGESYKQLIECINYAQTNHVDIGNDNMRNIFVAALKLVPIVRDKNAMPGSVTKTLMGLLNYSVVGVVPYKFEEIDNSMSLSEIRNIIKSNGTQIAKINALETHINALYHNCFYNTDDLYEKIKIFVASSRTNPEFYSYDSRIGSEYKNT